MGKKTATKVNKLIDEDEDYFTEKAEAVLKEIFSRYDSDKDGCLNDKELDAFAVGCNGKPFSASDKTDIAEAFDVNDKGYLTERGFLEMYFMQTTSEPSETMKDILAHGYDHSLNKKSDTTTETKEEEKKEEKPTENK